MSGGKGMINGNDGVKFSSERQPVNRRKSTKFLTDMLTKELKGKKDIIIEGFDPVTGAPAKIRVPMPTKEMIVQALLRKASKGDVIAIKEVFDRVEGKVTQPIAGDDKAPPINHALTVNIVRSDAPIATSEEEVN